MTRLLIIPAAGAGTRLGSALPKLLVPVAGRPMIDHLIERHAPWVDRYVLVINPAAEALVRPHIARDPRLALAFQPAPTGMLDAILAATPDADGFDQVWITWCDQVAIGAATAARLAEVMADPAPPDLALPTVRQPAPYIHFDRDDRGTIVHVRQRREGDLMPPEGEGDAGLFALSGHAFREWLPAFSREVAPASGTGERNFLPFIPWVAARGIVRTYAVTDPMEAVGINTPADLGRVEAYLRDHHAQHRHPRV